MCVCAHIYTTLTHVRCTTHCCITIFYFIILFIFYKIVFKLECLNNNIF